MPTENRTIAGRNIRLAEAGPVDAPLVVLLSPFPESILSFTRANQTPGGFRLCVETSLN